MSRGLGDVYKRQTLGTFKLYMRDKSDMECLDELIQDRRKAIRVRQEADLLSPEELDTGIWGLERLEEYALALKAENIRSKEDGMDRIKALFDQEANARKALVQEVKDRLHRAFAFLADCFGDGQEMILFLSPISHASTLTN